MWANFHSHSRYCDGKGELSEFLEAAKKQKVFSIGFSSHAPVPFDCKWSMEETALPSYLKDIEHAQLQFPDIQVYKGLEIDFVPGVVRPYEFRDQLDYTIGSIHFIDNFPDGRPWEIDNTRDIFQKGLSEIFKGNAREAIIRYYELTRELIYSSAPTIVGHLDKIKMQNEDEQYFQESEPWYRDEVLKTLKLIEQADLIVEVNTRGLYKKKTTSTYPSPWVLEHIYKMNIPITISSDAHVTEELTGKFPETAAMLAKIGFKTISVLTDDSWKPLPFNEHGVIR